VSSVRSDILCSLYLLEPSTPSSLYPSRGLVSLDHSSSIEGSTHRSLDSISVGVLYRRTVNLCRSCVGLGWLAQETTRFILVWASEE
jgi:hypothetical protein